MTKLSSGILVAACLVAGPALVASCATAVQRDFVGEGGSGGDVTTTGTGASSASSGGGASSASATGTTTSATSSSSSMGCTGDVDCDDGDACNVDTCQGSVCMHDPIVCDDVNACTADSCDAVAGCVFTPTPGAECAKGTCFNGIATAPSVCDGAGSCSVGPTFSCGYYACDPLTNGCKSSCFTNADCAPSATCAGNVCSGGCPPPSISAAGYCWVIALNSGETYDQACTRIGKSSPGYVVAGLLWTDVLMAEVTSKLGCNNLGDNNCCAPALFYYPATNNCETHEFGQDYTNYGSWDPVNNVGVYACNG